MKSIRHCVLILSPLCLLAQTPAPAPGAAKAPARGAAKPVAPSAAKPPAPGAAKPGAAAAKPASASKSPVILTIGSESVTQEDFEALVNALPDSMRALALTQDGKRKIAEQLAELKSLAQEARRQKLDQESPTKQELQLQIDQVLASAEMAKLSVANPVNETIVRQYYEDHKNNYQMVEARHILVRFKGSVVPIRPNQPDLAEEAALARATELRKKLDGGADFAELAKTESDDTSSGENGGDLGKFARGQMIPEFEEAAFALKDGQISQPIHTNYGFHLIQTKSHSARAFDDVKAEIESKVRPDHLKSLSADLRKKNTVVMDKGYFGEPTAEGEKTPK